MHWGTWPSEVHDVPFDHCDAMIVLGGGDHFARADVALQAIDLCDPDRIIVTGDGGHIVHLLRDADIPRERLFHEPLARSTFENAALTEPMIRDWKSKRVIIVTNWFHAYRAKRVFQSCFGDDVQFRVVADEKPAQTTQWDHWLHRRERYAILYYAVRYGVWPF